MCMIILNKKEQAGKKVYIMSKLSIEWLMQSENV